MSHRSWIRSVTLSLIFASLTVLSLPVTVLAGQLTLSWTDNSTSEDGFRIERRPGGSTTFTQIATVGANVTSYTDGGLPDATTYCYRVQGFNTAGSSGYSNEQCATTAAATTSFTLTVNKSGTGGGTVTGTGINCGADCSEPYTTGTSVTLTATAASGSTFAGWSGGGCTGTATTCTVSMSAAAAVTATFNIQSSTVNTISTNISDGAILIGSSVLWTGTPTGSPFRVEFLIDSVLSWTEFLSPYQFNGDPAGVLNTTTLTNGSHQLKVRAVYGNNSTAERTITVTVSNTSTQQFALAVTKAGTGSGTVTGTGINCGADCTEVLASGKSVVLTAGAASGSTFAGWSGGGCTGTGTCTVSMSAATTVTASFNLASGFALTVNVAVQAASGGSASGRVVSSPAGIDCGTDCTEAYTSGRVVALTPLPGAGSRFTGWTGNADCTDGSVTMNVNKSCTANFALNQALLTVTTNGNGTVASTSGGMTCSSSCTFASSLGSTITVRATPPTVSSFAGWSGAGCNGTADCTITLSTDKSVTATFVGSGSNPTDKIGVYRPSTGEWFLDLNGNGVWENCGTDHCVSTFSSRAGIPVVSDWDGSGVSQLGFFLTDTEEWQLDQNANETWDGCRVDDCVWNFGQNSDIPVTGKWSAKGADRIGFFRPRNGRWYLDRNGNEKWNGCDRDRCANLKIYQAGDLPVTGDWDGNGTTQVGLFRPRTGEWLLDYNGNRTWDGCSKDRCLSFGIVGQPVSGDWDGTGTSKIGVFDPSTGEWFLDLNGNGRWDGCGVDLCRTFGQAGDRPLVGKW